MTRLRIRKENRDSSPPGSGEVLGEVELRGSEFFSYMDDEENAATLWAFLCTPCEAFKKDGLVEYVETLEPGTREHLECKSALLYKIGLVGEFVDES